MDGWSASPQWKSKLVGFFKQAFQQTQTDILDYNEHLGINTNPWLGTDKALFVRAAEESFARTVVQLLDEGRPFTEAVTTERFMLNAPLMSAYAYVDAVPFNDDVRPVQSAFWLLKKFPNLTWTRTLNPDPVTGMPRPIPIEESVDPQSPNFMRWFDPRPGAGMPEICTAPQSRREDITRPRPVGAPGVQDHIFDFFFGGRVSCGATLSQWKPEDWNTWRMITVRRPRSSAEDRTIFWDLPKFRDPKTTELVLNTPRIGFFTTPAFFANWPTNISNSYRVAANQALIVALGRSFDDRGTTVQVTETSVDSMHIQPGTTCFGCHQVIDPMRDFFRHNYSVPYSQQLLDLRASGIPATGTFTVDNSPPVTGTGVEAFAKAMAQHPRFAAAWTQKLCQFANSESCIEQDPEFVRVTEAFRRSNHGFKVLVRELFSSPLVTFARSSRTAEELGVTVSIARREGLCAALEARLAITDLCALRGVNTARTSTTSKNLALSVPGAGYARGDEVPLLPHDPNMFFASAAENLCGLLAAQVVHAGGGSLYTSAKKDEAIRDLVATIVGLPVGHSRAGEMTTILNDHHAEAVRGGVSPTDALRSTFILACSSPFTVSMGL